MVGSKTGKKLILAEKPSQAADYAKALGNCKKREGYYDCGEFLITWAFGHLFEIDDSIAPKRWSLSDLPIFPERFKLRLRRGMGKQFKVIKELLKQVDEVFIGSDPGREGELLAREILLMAGWKDWNRVKRIWTSEALTPEVVKRAIKEALPANRLDGLYYSALARQHGDWIVGINLTRLVTLGARNTGDDEKGKRKVWSVGRVQTPTLRLIVERERERREFKPTPYWIIKALFEKDSVRFPAVLIFDKPQREGKDLQNLRGIDTDNETGEDSGEQIPTGAVIKDKATAERIFNEVKGIPYGVVLKVKKHKKREQPPLLHSLTTLQREANKLYGFSAAKTLAIAQKLYEERKIISYPRTDSRYLAEANRRLAAQILERLGYGDLAPKVYKVGKRVFDDTKLTDHHAIIPLAPAPASLTPEEKKIYQLITRRFVGAFMPPYEYEITEVILKVGDYKFLARGKKTLKKGWVELYPERKTEKVELPTLNEGEKVKKVDTLLEERKTQPPPRFTEGTLLKVMEKLGLGTPATRAQILETLKKRGYVTLKGKSLIPTDKGEQLIELLKTSEVSSPEMTARWEEQLEKIYTQRLNEEGYKTFLEGIKTFTATEMDRLKKLTAGGGSTAETPTEKSGGKTPVEERNRSATPKMLKLAKALARELGIKPPAEKDFQTVKTFIEEALEMKKRRVDEGLGTCPCGGKIIPFSKGWKCERCNRVVWKTFLGKRLTERQAVNLLKGKEVVLRGLKSKSGKKFNARVRLGENGKLEIVEFL